jgi:hypothetical protein
MPIEIPWEYGMSLGDGYHVKTLQKASPALNITELGGDRSITSGAMTGKYLLEKFWHVLNPKDPRKAVEIEWEFYTIRDEFELSSVLDATFKISIPKSPVFSLETSAGYLRSIKCNQTTITTLIRCSITSKYLERIKSTHLTERARKRLKKDSNVLRKSKFLETYGGHYISGFKYQSTLDACLTHSASTKEQLDEFKLRIGGNYKITEADGAISFMKKLESSHIDTKIAIKVVGYKAESVNKYLEDVSVTQFQDILKGFLKGYVPVRHVAILEAYHTIDEKAPIASKSPEPRDPEILTAYQNSLHLEIRAKSCRMVGAQNLIPEVTLLANQGRHFATAHALNKGWRKELARHKKKLQALKTQIDLYVNRENLLLSSRSLIPQEWAE